MTLFFGCYDPQNDGDGGWCHSEQSEESLTLNKTEIASLCSQ